MMMGRGVFCIDGSAIDFHCTKSMPFVYNIVFFVYINELFAGILYIIAWGFVQSNLQIIVLVQLFS